MNKDFLELKTIPAYWMWCPSKHGKQELELSVKSACKFAPWINEKYVLSITNPEIDGLIWIPIRKIQGGTENHLFNTINDNLDKLPKYWLYMNDDFYFLDNTTIEDFYYPYGYNDIKRKRNGHGTSGFSKLLWDTIERVDFLNYYGILLN